MRPLFLACLLLSAASLRAQSSQEALNTRLLNKVFFLRGLWKNDKLHFDPAGHLDGHSDVTNPMRSGLFVSSAQLTEDHLLILGNRVIVYREEGKLKAEQVGEPMELRFDLPPGADYDAALGAVITDNLEDLTATTPPKWLPCLDETLKTDQVTEPSTNVKQVTIPPKIVFQPEPKFPSELHGKHFQSKILVLLTLDPCGNPTHIRLARPSDVLLDQLSIDAVRQYRFEPALLNGVPVPFALQVQVVFTGS